MRVICEVVFAKEFGRPEAWTELNLMCEGTKRSYTPPVQDPARGRWVAYLLAKEPAKAGTPNN